jgi:beta-alanine--pyruvate transaminase
MLTLAKGITNAAVPMGAVCARQTLYDTVVNSAAPGIELFHGYTYSGHPLAAAAGLATLDLYQSEALFERAASLAPCWENALHSLRGLPHVVDIRNLGLVGGIELEPRPGAPGPRGFDEFHDSFNHNVLTRDTGEIIALSPPLIIEKHQIDELVGTLSDAIQRVS